MGEGLLPVSQKLGSRLLKQASERQISSLRWALGATFQNPWKPDPPCPSGLLLMTLSWVGSRGQSLLFDHSVMSDSLQPHGLQHASLPCPSLSPRACSNSCPQSRCAIQPSHPLSSPSPPALNLSQHQGLFQWVSSSHQVVKVLELQLQHQSF